MPSVEQEIRPARAVRGWLWARPARATNAKETVEMPTMLTCETQDVWGGSGERKLAEDLVEYEQSRRFVLGILDE